MTRLSRFLRSLPCRWMGGHLWHSPNHREHSLYQACVRCGLTRRPPDPTWQSPARDWLSLRALADDLTRQMEAQSNHWQAWRRGTAVKEAPVPEATPEAYTPQRGLPSESAIGVDALFMYLDYLEARKFASRSSTGAPAPTDASSTSTAKRSNGSLPSAVASSELRSPGE